MRPGPGSGATDLPRPRRLRQIQAPGRPRSPCRHPEPACPPTTIERLAEDGGAGHRERSGQAGERPRHDALARRFERDDRIERVVRRPSRRPESGDRRRRPRPRKRADVARRPASRHAEAPGAQQVDVVEPDLPAALPRRSRKVRTASDDERAAADAGGLSGERSRQIGEPIPLHSGRPVRLSARALSRSRAPRAAKCERDRCEPPRSSLRAPSSWTGHLESMCEVLADRLANARRLAAAQRLDETFVGRDDVPQRLAAGATQDADERKERNGQRIERVVERAVRRRAPRWRGAGRGRPAPARSSRCG